MRDPLHRMSIRIKLPLTFVVVGALTFGGGGWLVTGFARRELESHIRGRVDTASDACASALDGALKLVRSRAEDFASDGLIRRAVEDGTEERRIALGEHLRRNKLPLVLSFDDCCVFDCDGRPFANARPDRTPEALCAESKAGAAFAVGPIETAADGRPQFFVSVPIRRLDGSETVGTLAALVALDRLMAESVRGPSFLKDLWNVPATLLVADGRGGRWRADFADPEFRLAAVASDVGTDGDEIASDRALTASDWHSLVAVDARRALEPLRGLESRWLGVAIAIAVALLLALSVIVRFLVVPLTHLRDMARRMAEGDEECRVLPQSSDEIGDLGSAFNSMAEAVGKRNRKIREAHRRLEGVVDAMRDGLVLLDGKGEIVLANEAAMPLVGVIRTGRLAPVARRCPGGPHRRDCAACLATGRESTGDCVIEVGDRAYDVIESRLTGDGDGASGRVLVARDVTERMALQELEAHQERLAVLGEVTAVVAHDLNNPLAAISMFNQMMADDLGPDAPHREHVTVIARNIAAMKRAVRDLLDNVSGPGEALETDAGESVADVVRFLTPLARKAGVVLTLESSAESQSKIVRIDETRFRQSLINLVVNAIQAAGQAGPGHVGVVTGVGKGDVGEIWMVDVVDDGPGVPAPIRARIFEPFFTTKGGARGTGLGLPTARRTAEAHGGELVLLESAPGRTVFRMTIPVVAAASGALGPKKECLR